MRRGAWSRLDRLAHERGIVALSALDTRSLVLKLREGGAMRAAVISGDASLDEVQRAIDEQPSMAGRALVTEVSTTSPTSTPSRDV